MRSRERCLARLCGEAVRKAAPDIGGNTLVRDKVVDHATLIRFRPLPIMGLGPDAISGESEHQPDVLDGRPRCAFA